MQIKAMAMKPKPAGAKGAKNGGMMRDDSAVDLCTFKGEYSSLSVRALSSMGAQCAHNAKSSPFLSVYLPTQLLHNTSASKTLSSISIAIAPFSFLNPNTHRHPFRPARNHPSPFDLCFSLELWESIRYLVSCPSPATQPRTHTNQSKTAGSPTVAKPRPSSAGSIPLQKTKTKTHKKITTGDFEPTKLTGKASGKPATLEYRVNFTHKAKKISPWHDIPYRGGEGAVQVEVSCDT
jgi:hypothetical protein